MPDAAVLPVTALPRAGSPGFASVNAVSVGVDIPSRRLSSAEMAEMVGTQEDWIVSRTGIHERPWADPDEHLYEYAARAGGRALAAAGVAGAEVDLIIVATISADELTPAVSTHVARELGAVRAGAFDVAAACTGFLTGLALAAGQIESGRARTVLLIGADFVSRIIDRTDRASAPLFSDSAGAVLLVAGPPVPVVPGAAPGSIPNRDQPFVGPVILGCDGDPERNLYATVEQRQLQMKGPEIFRNAVARITQSSTEALAASELGLEDIDLFVCHQANARITAAVRGRLGLAEEQVVDCIGTLGNSSAATIPVALACAQDDGRLRPGTRLLLSAFGAGFSWGACVLHWGGSPPSSPPASVSANSSSAPASMPVSGGRGITHSRRV